MCKYFAVVFTPNHRRLRNVPSFLPDMEKLLQMGLFRPRSPPYLGIIGKIPRYSYLHKSFNSRERSCKSFILKVCVPLFSRGATTVNSKSTLATLPGTHTPNSSLKSGVCGFVSKLPGFMSNTVSSGPIQPASRSGHCDRNVCLPFLHSNPPLGPLF